MKSVDKRHKRPNPPIQALTGRLVILSLAWLVASCDGSGSGDDSMPLRNDASLSSLSTSVAALEPAFSSSVTDYTAAVGFGSKSMQVTASPEDANAIIRVNGAAVAAGAASDPIPLDEGYNTITIEVIVEDGTTTQTYTVAVARQSASAFNETAYVKASDARFEARFGPRLALSADGESLSVAAVGRENALPALDVFCNEDPDFDYNPKGVYEFTRDNEGVWTQHPFVDGSPFHYGSDLALSADGSTLAVSAAGYDGFVDVYSRDSNVVWLLEERIFVSSWLPVHESGIRVALSADGSTLAVGTVFGVDVLTRDHDRGWVQQVYLPALGAGFWEGFGDIALSANGAILAVGGWGEHVGLHVFARDSGDVWSEEAYDWSIPSNADVALSADGSTLVADAGLGFDVFTRDSGWTRQAHVQASNREYAAGGVALSADGAVLAFGAYGEDSAATGVNGDGTDNSAWGSGAVYVFTRDSRDAWTERAYIKASNTGAGDAFGYDVALSADGTVLAVGAPSEASAATGINGDSTDNSLPCSGAAYIFEIDESEPYRGPTFFNDRSVFDSAAGANQVVEDFESYASDEVCSITDPPRTAPCELITETVTYTSTAYDELAEIGSEGVRLFIGRVGPPTFGNSIYVPAPIPSKPADFVLTLNSRFVGFDVLGGGALAVQVTESDGTITTRNLAGGFEGVFFGAVSDVRIVELSIWDGYSNFGLDHVATQTPDIQ